MAHGVALKMREIRVHPEPLDDDYLFTNPKTGEVYDKNRHERRKDAMLGAKVNKHEAQTRKPQGWKEAKRKRRKLSATSRRRNR